MEHQDKILDAIEPDIAEEMISRRAALMGFGRWGRKATVASVPLALAGLAQNAFGQAQALPQQIVDVLNFALTLEHLEAEFYIRGMQAPGLIPADQRDIFDQIRKHEVAHVALLQSVLGNRAVAKPNFDFTAGGMFGNVFTNYATFATLAQGFEDTGVRAYKGQAPNLMSNKDILTTALRIHSVEARHAAEVRRLPISPDEKGWIVRDFTRVPALQAVYEGEGNFMQGGINVLAVSGRSPEAVTEAFDEPLSRQQVLAIAGMFIRQ